MKFKIIYKQAPVYIESESEGEDDRKAAVKGIIRTMKDLGAENLLSQSQTSQSVAENIVSEPVPEPIKPASAKQKDFMVKLHIPFDNDIDFITADALIKEAKARLGYK